MKVDVTEYEKNYTFELAPVTQLCGQNIVKKTFILESVRRYFGTYKYSEERNKWRDNIKIDNELVGRKFFTVLSIKEISDIITLIKWSKQSLMVEYVKQLMKKFDWQMHMHAINEELEEMFLIMNSDINQLGDVELSYALSDVWDMIQKTNITGSNQTMLENKGNDELIIIFLNLLEKIMESEPQKLLIIIENIDHMISQKEYIDVVNKIKIIGMKYDIYFVLSTSIDGYVVCDRELCSGITIFGDRDFQMPEFDRMLNYIYDNYPCNKKLSEAQMQKILTKIIQRIGHNDYLYSVEESVICKLINQTLMLNEKWLDVEKIPEIAFLKA
jgi:hypothetical protein